MLAVEASVRRSVGATILVIAAAVLLSGCSLLDRLAPVPLPEATPAPARVELPDAGIALRFPDGWSIDTSPPQASSGLSAIIGPESRALVTTLVAAVPPSMHDRCEVMDIGPLVQSRPEWSTLDDIVTGIEGVVDADPRWVGVEGTLIDLPAGSSGRIVRTLAGEAETWSTYVFGQTGAWYVLECVAHTVPPEDWGPVAATFELLPAE